MIATWLLVGVAWAGAPELVVVGVHTPGLSGPAGEAAAKRLADAFDATGKVDALTPDEARARIAGREALILDGFALGPGRDALKEGKILYDRAQPDQAIPVLEQATRQLAAGLATSTDVRDLHDALTLLGLANAGLGNEAAARTAFRRSVTLDPSRQLDAVNYPPQIVALYQSVRAAAQTETPAVLTVVAPGGTTLLVDGRTATGGSELSLVPGEHHVLLREADGDAFFETLTLAAGEKRTLTPSVSPRAVGRAAADAAGRSRQVRDLYRSIGQYVDRDPVLLAGTTTSGQVALQLYAPASGNFSRALTADAGNDPVAAMLDLVPSVVGFLGDTGDIKPDRVSPQIVALDVGSNELLASFLFEPSRPGLVATEPTAKKGAPWYLWAGLGVVVAGGGATAAVLLADQGGGTGTITLGPIP